MFEPNDDKYKREKLMASFTQVKTSLTALKKEIAFIETEALDSFNNDVYEKAICTDYSTFSEFIVHMCRAYLFHVPAESELDLNYVETVKLAQATGFFEQSLGVFLVKCVRLRNNYTHEYWKRNIHASNILELCKRNLTNFTLFLDIVNVKLISNLSDNSEE